MDNTINSSKAQADSGGETSTGEEWREMLATAKARVVELEQALAGKEGEITTLKTSMNGLEVKVKDLGGSLSAAIEGYRALIVQANPEILPDLVHGESIPAIEESVKQGREIVNRIKRGVEKELTKGKFPAGSPERGRAELDLSPREKIQQGISAAGPR